MHANSATVIAFRPAAKEDARDEEERARLELAMLRISRGYPTDRLAALVRRMESEPRRGQGFTSPT